MESAPTATTTLEIATAISVLDVKMESKAMSPSVFIADTRSTVTKLTSSDLRIAYTAVRMQRINADMRKAWLDEAMREAYVAAEKSLESALREADVQKEIEARGGKKPAVAA
jgi:hypothetical protein